MTWSRSSCTRCMHCATAALSSLTKLVVIHGDDLHAARDGQAWRHGVSDGRITRGHHRCSVHHPPRQIPNRKSRRNAGRGWTVIGVSVAASGGTSLRSRCSYHAHLPPSQRGAIILTTPLGHMLRLMWTLACGDGIAATPSRRRPDCVQEVPSRIESPCVLPHAAGGGIAQAFEGIHFLTLDCRVLSTLHCSSIPCSRPTVSPCTQH